MNPTNLVFSAANLDDPILLEFIKFNDSEEEGPEEEVK